MRRLILSYIFSSLTFTTIAQVVTIRDAETNLPLESVTLSSDRPAASTFTNANGQADISGLQGAQEVLIRLLGYQPLSLSYEHIVSSGLIISMETSSFSLDQVVVSASRWNQQARELPVHIAVISPREASLLNPQTAADLLEISGQVFVQKSQQGGGSPMIRGFATNRLLIAVDGIRMNTAIFRSGNLQNVISLDPFATERTEVLFGPGSVIYGSDAIGGVMSFHTLEPRFSLADELLVKGSAVARVTSANNEKTSHFDFNVGGEKWASVTSFSHNNYGDLKMGSHGPKEYLRPFYVQRIDSVDRTIVNDDPRVQRPSGYTQANLMQKTRFRPNKEWDLTYAFHYSETSEYSRYDRHIRYRNGLQRSGEWRYGPQRWQMNNLITTHSRSTGLYDQMTIRLAHQLMEESRIDRDLNEAERRTRIEKVNAWSGNVDLNKTLGDDRKLFYGLELIHNDVTSTGINEDIRTGTVEAGPARYPQSEWSSYAAYATYQHRLSQRFLLQFGARYNVFGLEAVFDTSFYQFPFAATELSNDALTGSAGIVVSPGKDFTFSTNVSTGFRSPNVDDVGKVFDSEPGAVVVPNPGLESEYAYSAEIGIAKVFGDAVRLDFSTYYTLLENAMVRRNYTLGGQDSIVYDGEMSRVQAIQNAARATVFGFQAGLELKLSAEFSLMSRFNVQVGEEELDGGTSSPARHAAPSFGATHLVYAAKGLRFDLYARYSAGFDFEELPQEERGKAEIYAVDKYGNPHSPGWYTLNLKASQSLTEQITIAAGIENITDQRYRPYSSGLAAPGRNFVLSLRANF